MSLDRSYNGTIEYLYGLQKHGIKFGLENSVALMAALGDPHRSFRSVHVAGTNGKGSTSAYIASMLRAAGLRVGLYTSPHLISFTERIQINNEPVSEQRVVELAQRVRDAWERLSAGRGSAIDPTFFEVTTAMAFLHFAEEQIDIAVIETGMGGRLDATNVVTPLMSVITTIDIEHKEFLGDTLAKIAAEKAGIIKQRVPIVTGLLKAEAFGVIERTAAATDAPLFPLGKRFFVGNVIEEDGVRFDFRGASFYPELHVRMLGRHQAENAGLAVAAIEHLRDAGIDVNETAVRKGLAETAWPGRLEMVSRRPDILLDGAHNPASAEVLAAALRTLSNRYRSVMLVIGVLADKDIAGVIRPLVRAATTVIATAARYNRALGAQQLAEELRKHHAHVSSAETVEEALRTAVGRAAPDDLIVVAGSLFVVGEARALFVNAAGLQAGLAGLKG
jgi:dihydrofolate synthase/folylpolyglutamate synthase